MRLNELIKSALKNAERVTIHSHNEIKIDYVDGKTSMLVYKDKLMLYYFMGESPMMDQFTVKTDILKLSQYIERELRGFMMEPGWKHVSYVKIPK
jgi:hypothetical protein